MSLWELLNVCAVQAQPTRQVWSNLTLDWVESERLTYELDFEPKILVSAPEGEPDWWSLDVTPNVEYAATRWLDLVAEAAIGHTNQTDHLNSVELTPRAGLRVHFLSRGIPTAGLPEAPHRRRIVVRDLVRVESRNLFYTREGRGSSSTVRFRNRLEFLVPLNREKMTDAGARYLLADWEWFVPLGEPDERFASRQRIRAGLGYRRSFAWRFEVLYIWTRSRNTIEEGFTTDDGSLDIRVKRVF
jgi:hypothetical protein